MGFWRWGVLLSAPSFLISLLRGYCSSITWNVRIEPYYYSAIDKKSVMELSQTVEPTDPNAVFLSNTACPGPVGFGQAAMRVNWITYRDHTWLTPVPNASGWILSEVPSSSRKPSETTADLVNGCSVFSSGIGYGFSWILGDTYTAVRKDYQVPVSTFIGATLGLVGSIIAGFAAVLRILEKRRAKKQGIESSATVSSLLRNSLAGGPDDFDDDHDSHNGSRLFTPLLPVNSPSEFDSEGHPQASPRSAYTEFESPRGAAPPAPTSRRTPIPPGRKME